MKKTNLELIVDQPVPGHFYWTVLWRGQSGDLPRVIDYARGPFPTRSSAMTSGAAAMRVQLAEEAEAEAEAHTALMLSGMRVDWGSETMPAHLL